MKRSFDITTGKARFHGLLLSRTAVWLAIAVIASIALFKVALPLFVSTASVKLNMEQALSSWTGAQARIVGDPDIAFWPHPVLTLHTVTFEGGDAAAPELLAKADAISAGFDLLAALRGTPVFYDFHLLNPVFKIERRVDGSLNWRRAGWMADSIADAAAKEPSSVASTPIGDIDIENGTVELVDRITATAHRLTDVSGSIDWPAPASKVSARLSAMLNGESVALSVICDSPIALLSGASSVIRTSFTSAPLSVSFEGTANNSAHPFASGHLQLTASSAAKLMAWSGAQVPPEGASSTVTIDTGIAASTQALKMDNLSLSLNGSNATGVLDIGWRPQASARIDGTLAFDRIDLTSLLASFRPLLQKNDAANGASLLDRISLDLRLSAREASYGPVALTDVAAGIIAQSDSTSIDIGAATYSGGALSGRLAFAGNGADGGQLRFSLENADLAAIASSIGLQGPLPLGRNTLNVDLATGDPLPAITMNGISGEIRYSAIDGRLTNFDGPEFERLAVQGGFFNINQAADGSFAFATADIDAALKRGVAELTRADIRGEGRTLSLAGVIPYRSGGLALAGAIRPDDTTLPAVRFFIGGSWPNAVISPLSAIPSPQ